MIVTTFIANPVKHGGMSSIRVLKTEIVTIPSLQPWKCWTCHATILIVLVAFNTFYFYPSISGENITSCTVIPHGLFEFIWP